MDSGPPLAGEKDHYHHSSSCLSSDGPWLLDGAELVGEKEHHSSSSLSSDGTWLLDGAELAGEKEHHSSSLFIVLFEL